MVHLIFLFIFFRLCGLRAASTSGLVPLTRARAAKAGGMAVPHAGPALIGLFVWQ